MKRSLFLSALGLWVLPVAGSAQALDTVVAIPVFEKPASVNKPSASYFSQDFDSLRQRTDLTGMDLSQFLADESNVFIKDYGPGLLSTPSYRGGDASQTVLIWNGAKLNSPMLGTSDLSTIAIDQFDQLSVFTSSSSNSYSSGGIGGGIWLGNEPDYSNTYGAIDLKGGSFGLHAQSLDANAVLKPRKHPIALHAAWSQRSAQNGFPYLDISSEPYVERERQHSAYRNLNFQASLSSFLGEKLEYTARYWHTRSEQQVPNTIKLKVPAEALQRDTAHRLQMLVKYYPSKKWRLSFMGFMEANSNFYRDDRIDLRNLNRYRSFQQTAEAGREVCRWLGLSLILNNQYVAATTGNYSGREEQQQQSAMVRAQASVWKGTELVPAFKVQRFEGRHYFLPNIGLRQPVLKDGRLDLLLNYSETVRLPTLNELYWVPGGNPELRAEQGKTAEAGLSSSGRIKKTLFRARLSYFTGRFEHWIRWVPKGPSFSPQNILTVHQQGLDGNGRVEGRWRKLRWAVSFNGVWNSIVDRRAGEEFQMVYVPDFQWSSGLNLRYRFASLRYTHSYTGYRYISSDNLRFMPPFQLGRLVASVRFQWKWNVAGALTAGVDNLWNTGYQVLAWRPMPGRNYFINLNLRWQKR